MMDDREDRLDEFVRDAARDYNAPPPVPRAEMWEQIRTQRSAARPTGILPFRRPTLVALLAIAAILVLGVAIGRLTAPGVTTAPLAPAITAATPDKLERREIAAELVTTGHLSRIETFLTEFGSSTGSHEVTDQARDLLATTRLLIDSKRVTDPRTHKLLEDLELVLVQIATLNPKDRREDLDLIADGLAHSQLRTRLRNAIPTGPAIRL